MKNINQTSNVTLRGIAEANSVFVQYIFGRPSTYQCIKLAFHLPQIPVSTKKPLKGPSTIQNNGQWIRDASRDQAAR